MPSPSQTDTLHEILARQRRRNILRCLEESETPITVAELAKDVARHEQESNLSEIPDDIVHQIHVYLYHVDLPKLADAGLITYNDQMKTVRLDGHSDVVEELLRVEEDSNTVP